MSDDTPIFAAVRAGDLRAVSALLKVNRHLTMAKSQYGTPVLFEAVNAGCPAIAEILIANGAKVSSKYDDRTLLHGAVGSLSGIGHSEILLMLLSHGIDPNAKDKSGSTPLHYAVRSSEWANSHSKESVFIVEFLLANRADPNSYDLRHCTPLHVIGETDQRNRTIIDSLIYYGADIRAKDKYGDEPLHYAAARSSLEVSEYFVQKGASVDAKDEAQRTPLHTAVSNGHKDVAVFLLKRGAEVDAQDCRGMSPFHQLSASASPNIDLVKVLTDASAAVNLADNEGWTPLHTAAFCGQKALIESLLACGADPRLTDKYGRNAAQIADREGNREITKMLAGL